MSAMYEDLLTSADLGRPVVREGAGRKKQRQVGGLPSLKRLVHNFAASVGLPKRQGYMKSRPKTRQTCSEWSVQGLQSFFRHIRK